VTCARCRATFAALGSESTIQHALRLDEQEPLCRCQGVSVSEHSPGRVEDAETLIRILVAPQHIDRKTGLPRAAALTHAETIGLSVLRDRATNNEILSLATRLVQNARSNQANPDKAKKVGVFGVLRMACNAVRAFRWEMEVKPSYCVYDTALEQWRSHADAFQRVAGALDGVPDARRNALFELVRGGFVSVREFRHGLLKGLAPDPEA